ncbi:acyl-CoA reductase [Streptomyces sp. NPDC002463]|uniref:acyl-CoA reductase n=1 Tax=Streptomyces sp. NPDC002463 TaxID=3364645 RepID=UPI0036B71649
MTAPTLPPDTAAGSLTVPAYVRGTTVTDRLVPFGGRPGRPAFHAPDPAALLPRLPLRDPSALRELHGLSTAEIIDLLTALGPLLTLEANPLLREALRTAAAWSDMTEPVLRAAYEGLPALFTREALHDVAEHTVGTRFLDGWVPVPGRDGRGAAVRAVGARTVHVIAGNHPMIAALTVIRNALTRSDAIVKTPSNDPLTAVAIARTLADAAPDHPLTRHLAVAYWKGGDETVEQTLYQPRNLDKIIAWGGMAAMRHITRYVRPGLEIVALDPKASGTVIGPEGFTDAAAMAHSAKLAAADVGELNQLACFNARVVHVVTGTDAGGLRRAEEWAELLHAEIQALPAHRSTPARHFDPALREHLRALRATGGDWYRVIGGRADEGAVVLSRTPDPVSFHTALSGRVANVIPVDDTGQALSGMDASTQTLGVYPDVLKEQLRDLAPFHGVQRLVPLGRATDYRPDLPQDATEPLRRMVRWITDESHDPTAASGGRR